MNLQTVAAVDVGSNAVRCLISDVRRFQPDKAVKKCAYLRIPLRLGADVFARGRISEEKKTLFREAMLALLHLMRAYSVDHYRICATSAMRDAANGLDLLAAVKDDTGLEMSVVSGLEEAEILFEANVFSRCLRTGEAALYIDVGGGSTEVVLARAGRLVEAFSFQLGTLRLLAGAVAAEERRRFTRELRRLAAEWRPRSIIATGGNINKAAKLLDKKEDRLTSVAELRALHAALEGLDVEARMSRFRLNSYRADVIVPALEIFLKAADTAGVMQFAIPKIGLVDGIVRHMCLHADARPTLSPPAPIAP
jgi:exopolyphosphatase/guanosine-5'-triphosphate,3'-diphosphate pyrophosphatase